MNASLETQTQTIPPRMSLQTTFRYSLRLFNKPQAVKPNQPGLDSACDPPANSPLIKAQFVRGTCEVVCFNPAHNLTIADMDRGKRFLVFFDLFFFYIDQILDVVNEWTSSYKRLSRLDYINHVQIFENKVRPDISDFFPAGSDYGLLKSPPAWPGAIPFLDANSSSPLYPNSRYGPPNTSRKIRGESSTLLLHIKPSTVPACCAIM